jgi:hypothetical protein
LRSPFEACAADVVLGRGADQICREGAKTFTIDESRKITVFKWAPEYYIKPIDTRGKWSEDAVRSKRNEKESEAFRQVVLYTIWTLRSGGALSNRTI